MPEVHKYTWFKEVNREFIFVVTDGCHRQIAVSLDLFGGVIGAMAPEYTGQPSDSSLLRSYAKAYLDAADIIDAANERKNSIIQERGSK